MLCVYRSEKQMQSDIKVVTQHKETCGQVFFRETGASRKLNAMFSCRGVFRFADQASVGKSLLDGNKDHLLNQAKQEHQV